MHTSSGIGTAAKPLSTFSIPCHRLSISSPPVTASLHEELALVLDEGRPLLLIHENRPTHGATPFAFFLRTTPRSLLDKGIYQTLALPLFGGDHQVVSARRILSAINRLGGSSRPKGQPARRLCSAIVDCARKLRAPRAARKTRLLMPPEEILPSKDGTELARAPSLGAQLDVNSMKV